MGSIFEAIAGPPDRSLTARHAKEFEQAASDWEAYRNVASEDFERSKQNQLAAFAPTADMMSQVRGDDLARAHPGMNPSEVNAWSDRYTRRPIGLTEPQKLNAAFGGGDERVGALWRADEKKRIAETGTAYNPDENLRLELERIDAEDWG